MGRASLPDRVSSREPDTGFEVRALGAVRMDVGLWLESLGLGQYRRRFAEQAVDAAVLRDLTEQDLAELGVLIGHRRKLLRAIGLLEETASGRDEPAGNRPARDAAQAPNRIALHHDGERRLLTVVFCDLVDSTALATRLDPEDTRR